MRTSYERVMPLKDLGFETYSLCQLGAPWLEECCLSGLLVPQCWSVCQTSPIKPQGIECGCPGTRWGGGGGLASQTASLAGDGVGGVGKGGCASQLTGITEGGGGGLRRGGPRPGAMAPNGRRGRNVCRKRLTAVFASAGSGRCGHTPGTGGGTHCGMRSG